MANFDDLQGAVAQFGANNKVIFDDTGMPSIMVAVPKAKYSDVITGGTDETLPFWIMDGEEKSVIYVSKFLNIVENDRAYSLGGYLPRNYINFDQSVAACKKKGAGWHLNQTGVFAYLNLLSQKWVLYHTETQTTARIITTLTRGEQCHRENHRERLQEADSLHGITITICRVLRTLTATFGSGPVDYALWTEKFRLSLMVTL